MAGDSGRRQQLSTCRALPLPIFMTPGRRMRQAAPHAAFRRITPLGKGVLGRRTTLPK